MKRILLSLFIMGLAIIGISTLNAQSITGTITGHSEGDNFSATETFDYSFTATGLSEGLLYKFVVSQDCNQNYYIKADDAWNELNNAWYKTYDQYKNISMASGETSYSNSGTITLLTEWSSNAEDVRQVLDGAGTINFVIKDDDATTDDVAHKFAINIVSSPNDFSDVKAFESKVYPNPALDVLNIDAPEGSSIAIYNAAGSLVKFSSFTNQLAIDDLSSGVYFVRIESEGKAVVEKIQVK